MGWYDLNRQGLQCGSTIHLYFSTSTMAGMGQIADSLECPVGWIMCMPTTPLPPPVTWRAGPVLRCSDSPSVFACPCLMQLNGVVG